MEQQPISHDPTSLDLVEIPPKDQPLLNQELLESQHITSAILSVKKAQEDNFDDISAATTRLQEHKDELYQDYNGISSSQTVGAFYTKLYSELSSQGATSQEINQLFIKCLKAYIPHKEIAIRPTEMNRLTAQKIIALVQAQLPRPKWFQQSEEEWKVFLMGRINIPIYLHTGEKTVHESNGKSIITRCYPHMVYEDQVPDWFEKLDTLPQEELKTLIDAEFLEDDEQRKAIVKRIEEIPRLADNLTKYYFGKNDKYTTWLNDTFRKYADKGFPNLQSFLIYLKPMSSVLTQRKTALLEGTDEPTAASLLINEYMNRHPLSSEFVAVWVEENLNRIGIDKPGGLDKKTLASVLRDMKSEDALEKLWKPIQTADKKQYRFLRYGLGELLKSSSDEERQILADMVEQESLPKAILEIARNISEYRDKILTDDDANTVKALKDVNEYSTEWFKKNYRWLQNRLFQQIHNSQNDQSELSKPVENDTTATQESHSSQIEIPKIEETDTIVNPLQQWKIAYTTSIHNPEGNNLISLSSSNSQELLEKLEDFIRSQKIGTTVKTSSIVNCLEQIISTPSEIEMLTPHLGDHYSDVDYKKRKRGGMRILYRLDPDNKTLTFWLHKKKSDTYKLD